MAVLLFLFPAFRYMGRTVVTIVIRERLNGFLGKAVSERGECVVCLGRRLEGGVSRFKVLG